ncbi:MAG TPA: metallophosphoesterase [Ktedonobacteraceae bacterium]|nr:metallophosphoesterase [Ktedonobacteraceae bacterium]
MSNTIKLIISDLHLADGHPIMEGFGTRQQAALEGLLQATVDGTIARPSDDVELIINGDCFDFLGTPPYNTHGTSNPTIALTKLDKIIEAHQPFFRVLQTFVATRGRSITFLVGNHDIELCFAEVRSRLYEAFAHQATHPHIYFCPTRSYRPLADVHIEHGNHYDFWNQALPGLWDEKGQPLTTTPASITLPVGSLYVQEVSHILNMEYPYFDHFEPSINIIRQIALLSLLNPTILLNLSKKTDLFLTNAEQLPPHVQQIDPSDFTPAELFSQTMLQFSQLQQALALRKTDGTTPKKLDIQVEDIQEFTLLREALTLTLNEAVTTICLPAVYQMEKSVDTGLKHVLHNDSSLRYAIAGHTHMLRYLTEPKTGQVYLNSGTWTDRLALPTPEEIITELIDWLRKPDWSQIPLRDVTRLSFVLLTGNDGEASDARICSWEGGRQGCLKGVTLEEGNREL